jgi:hypothetical protein
MLLAYLFSARDKREVRVVGALKGSLAAATAMLVAGGLVIVAASVL